MKSLNHTLRTLFVIHSVFYCPHFLAAYILSHLNFNNNNSNEGNLIINFKFLMITVLLFILGHDDDNDDDNCVEVNLLRS